MVAVAAGVQMLITASGTGLTAVMAAMAVLWLIATIHHSLLAKLPLAMFEEVHPPMPHWPDAPATYLQLSEAYADQAAMARELGWPVTRRMSHHLAPLTDPGLVTESLRELLGQLRQHRNLTAG